MNVKLEVSHLFDGGGNVSIFTADSSNMEMVEIEIAGPVYELKPGQTMHFKEHWQLYRHDEQTRSIDNVIEFVKRQLNHGIIK